MIKLEDVERGYARWAAKPHNAIWVRRIDGTPIANDICVNIFDELKSASLSPISADAVVEACAQIAYRVCAETRHVTLGDKARSEILALKGTFPAVDGWRTMDSAPDKGVFIGWDDRAGMRFVVVGDHFGEKRYYDADALEGGNYIRAHPTHWVRLTLPAAPSTQEPIRSALIDPEGGV